MKYSHALGVILFTLLILSCGDDQTGELQIEEPERVSLLIDSLASKKLNDKRLRALEKGVLISKKKDWVSAQFVVDEDTLRAQVRLKGDWTDHLEGEKWSFRVRLIDGDLWKGMSVFSLQAPETRYFLHEWVTHKLFEDQGVLCTQYGFTRLMVNDQLKGIYAYEEHFTPELLNRTGRGEGLLLKFDEDVLWGVRAKHDKQDFRYLPYLEGAEIETFDKDVYKDPQRIPLFITAQHLLHQYRHGAVTSSQIFKPDKLAMYLAVCDITRSYHALVWHNQRFYFDSFAGNLEPIAFDCFTHSGPYDWLKKSHLGVTYDPVVSRQEQPLRGYVFSLLNDQMVHQAYLDALEQISNTDFIERFQADIAEELAYWNYWLTTEYVDYTYDNGWLLDNAQNLRQALRKNHFDPQQLDTKYHPPAPRLLSFPDSFVPPYKGLAVKGYYFQDTVWLTNYYYHPTVVTAIGDSVLQQPIGFKGYTETSIPYFLPVPFKGSKKRITYTVPSSESLFSSKIKKKPHPY